ncbi:hypothetical protein EYF80_048893 [Liparis tanakae]|uniref:Uncharacterized protein n=1 Tax=Liparis tanakae TaxID=230148 RepID=A0A4Z2FJ39_9TELE|nr:hypothetical protein EYF80_048893 [Liparis tanakae]
MTTSLPPSVDDPGTATARTTSTAAESTARETSSKPITLGQSGASIDVWTTSERRFEGIGTAIFLSLFLASAACTASPEDRRRWYREDEDGVTGALLSRPVDVSIPGTERIRFHRRKDTESDNEKRRMKWTTPAPQAPDGKELRDARRWENNSTPENSREALPIALEVVEEHLQEVDDILLEKLMAVDILRLHKNSLKVVD